MTAMVTGLFIAEHNRIAGKAGRILFVYECPKTANSFFKNINTIRLLDIALNSDGVELTKTYSCLT